MADFSGLPDAIDLGEVNPTTVPTLLKLVQLASLSQYSVVVFASGGQLFAHCIPTTRAITDALGKPTAGL